MTPEEKLAAIAVVYETTRTAIGGATVSSHARHNLEGALIDMDRTGVADEVCRNTVRRVCRQLADIERILKL